MESAPNNSALIIIMKMQHLSRHSSENVVLSFNCGKHGAVFETNVYSSLGFNSLNI